MRSTLARSSKAVNLRLRGSCYAFDVAASAVLAQILQLPAEERAKLALELLRSLDDRADPDSAAAWDAELDRRADEVVNGQAETLTLDEYRAHVGRRRGIGRRSSTRAIARLRGCPRG